MNPWSKEDYWWAFYPTILTGSLSWEQLKAKIALLTFCSNKQMCPGTVKLWQAVADKTILPGGGGHALDISLFEGNLIDLGKFFGYSQAEIDNIITSGSSNDNGEGDNDMTSIWSAKAKGLYVEDKNGKIDPSKLEGLDFLIGKVGTKFTENVQSAADAKVPMFLFYANDPELYLDMGLNPAKWPTADLDPQIAILDNMIYSGGAKRTIHGIMLDCSKVKMTSDPTRNLTASWIAQSGQYMLNLIKVRYGLPVYMYMNKSPVTVWANDPDGKEQLFSFIKANHVSTVSSVLAANMDGIVPANGQSPSLPYDDGAVIWKFWIYSGMESGLRVLFNGTRQNLFEELKYQGTSVPVDNGGGGDTPPVTTIDLSEVNQKLDILIADIQAIKKHFVQF
jgi:hypothetical protein